MGSLGDVTTQRSVWAQKKFRKKPNRNLFFNFY